MVRLLSALVLFASAAALAEGEPAAAPAEAGPKLKLVVVPFTALSPDVPAKAGTKAAGMLSTEFKSAEAFALVDAKKDKPADPWEAELTGARADVDEAKALRGKKKFRLADEALQKALAHYKAGAVGVADVAEVQDTYTLLSAVQYNTGRDDEGVKSLGAGLCLAPDRELPLEKTSALFGHVVAGQRKAVKDGSKGSLLVQSVPAGAPVTVDGVGLGTTPLLVKDVPPGQHFWHAQLSSGEVVGGVLDVAAGKQQTLNLQGVNKDPESRLLAALSANKLDDAVVSAAKEHAKAVEADVLLFGALSRDGKGLALDAFLFNAQSGEVRRLPRPSFDAELLSAGMEFYNLAGDLSKKGGKAGDVVKLPAAVATAPMKSDLKVAEARFGVPPDKANLADGLEAEGATDASKDPAKDEPRKPVEPTRRVPLKKK